MSGRRANGEGTIYQRQDGRWEGAAYILTTDGTRKRVRVYGRTRADAHERLTALVAQTQRGQPVASTRQTVAEFLSYWLANVAAHRVRANTLERYEVLIRVHLVPHLGGRPLARLAPRDVQGMVSALGASGLSPRTVQHAHTVLRAALHHAVRMDLVPRNVATQVQAPAPRPEERPALSVAEAWRLLDVARAHRLHALYVLLVVLGLRRSEALGLRWEDVDLDDGVLRVRQGLQRVRSVGLQFMPTKTRRSRRTVPLPAACVDALREHRKGQDEERARAASDWPETGLVFTSTTGTPIDPRTFSRMFAKLSTRARRASRSAA